jgi:hypothetical protein
VRAATIPRYVRFAQQVERARRKGLHGDELVIYVRALVESYARFDGRYQTANGKWQTAGRGRGAKGDCRLQIPNGKWQTAGRGRGARGDCRLQIPDGKWQTAGRGPRPLSSAGGLERRVLVRLAGELFTIRVPQPGR